MIENNKFIRQAIYKKVECLGTCDEPFARFGLCSKYYCKERDEKHIMPVFDTEIKFTKKEFKF